MEELPKESWFYSHEGERLGPVTLAELRTLAQSGDLDPRLDLVWVQGMADWKPAGEVDGLFERRAAAVPEEAFAAADDPYTSPRQDHAAEMMGRGEQWPGVRRRGYLFGVLIFPLLWGFMAGLLTPFLTEQLEGPANTAVGIVAVVVPMVVGIAFTLMRFQNLGMTRWWILGNFVPLLNLWVGYRCFACPAGYAYHKKLDGPGIALAIFYWLLVLIGMIAFIVVVAILAGEVGGPELQETLREAIEQAETGRP